jgi:hypothetical protein
MYTFFDSWVWSGGIYVGNDGVDPDHVPALDQPLGRGDLEAVYVSIGEAPFELFQAICQLGEL